MPAGRPLASVVIRAKDEAASIGRLIDILGEQSIADRLELIVVDSGSRDGTLEIVRGHGIEPILVSPNDFSFGGALNTGCEVAAAPIIMALSAHAFPPDREWAERMVAALDDPGVACACGDDRGPDGTPLDEPVRQDERHASRYPFWGYSNAAGAFRAELWRQRPWRADMPGTEDKEWARHWQRRGWAVLVDQRLCVDHDHSHDPLPLVYERSRREWRGYAMYLDLEPFPLRAALSSWWNEVDGHASRARARLSPWRVAKLAGEWSGRRLQGSPPPLDGTLPITTVIPAYQCADLLERALRSVAAQVPAPAEVIVVDDASADDTPSVAARFGARLETHAVNQGEGASRNTGLLAALNPWVALLDCDDEWLPGHLALLWQARGSHVLVGSAALGCGVRAHDHRAYGWAGRTPLVMHGPPDVAVPENKITASSVLIDRNAALAAGGFRTDLRRVTDLDLWLRMLERGTGLAIPRVTALYHQHARQVSADRLAMHTAQQAVIDSYSDRSWCTVSLRRQHEGRVAWDAARAAIADGAPVATTVAGLARQLVVPQRAVGVVKLLAGRSAIRRMTSRYSPGGGPSVAILPGAAPGAAAGGPGQVDLRGHSLPVALILLAFGPTAQALVGTRTAAALVRLLGVKPVSAPRGRAGTAG